ncbi:general secretion pathway protein GspL [Escherichia coli O121:H19]|nr:general secretion pathway protein GspL [Escherichia coli O121:H19]AWJ26442.1 general secretion pathway protein GspL [Escherichia coli O121 str. RM8352]QCH73031.1 general secretion pathway protein GspL [Escherichia coli O121:H19]RFR00515.1 general secretion pathway protein GspL [Escherichia coli]TJR69635.1 general secretion pathway protein GspL [Escherichia coli]
MSIYIDGRDCCQTGQFSQDVADGALTNIRHCLSENVLPYRSNM